MKTLISITLLLFVSFASADERTLTPEQMQAIASEGAPDGAQS